MTDREILAGNRTLAKFMGEEKRNLNLDKEKSGYCYHNSWDWLMPVVIKLVYDYNFEYIFNEGDQPDKKKVLENTWTDVASVVRRIKRKNSEKEDEEL